MQQQMNKKQAEQILRQVIDTMKLTRQEYVVLLQAIEVLKAPEAPEATDPVK